MTLACLILRQSLCIGLQCFTQLNQTGQSWNPYCSIWSPLNIKHALIIVADTQATQFRLQICRISLCAREISSKSKCPRGADASRAFTEKRKAAFLRFRLHKAAIAWTALFAWPDHAGKPNTQLKRFHRMAERPRLVCFHIKGRLGKNRLIGRSITKTDADAHVCASPFLSQTCACPFNTLEQIYQL